jgi:hypothetical protein
MSSPASTPTGAPSNRDPPDDTRKSNSRRKVSAPQLYARCRPGFSTRKPNGLRTSTPAFWCDGPTARSGSWRPIHRLCASVHRRAGPDRVARGAGGARREQRAHLRRPPADRQQPRPAGLREASTSLSEPMATGAASMPAALGAAATAGVPLRDHPRHPWPHGRLRPRALGRCPVRPAR